MISQIENIGGLVGRIDEQQKRFQIVYSHRRSEPLTEDELESAKLFFDEIEYTDFEVEEVQ